MPMLTERHAKDIRGVLSCFDRMLIMGTLPDIAHAKAFTRELNRCGIRIFDFSRFAQELRDRIRDHAERLATEHGLPIEFIKKIKAFRKEDRIQEILAERGTHPGLVHIFSAMESCSSFNPWHDKPSGKTFLLADSGRCLHYYFYLIYFYLIDPELGLCHLRVPTWAPFRLQFCMNGHNWLASRLEKTLYSLGVMAELLGAANRRYLEFLSSLDDDSEGRRKLEELSGRVRDANRSYRGINFFDVLDLDLFLAIVRGEFNIHGFQVRDLRRLLPHLTGPQLSRLVKRLRMHRLVKKVRGTYRYYLTRLGRRVTAAALRLAPPFRSGARSPAFPSRPRASPLGAGAEGGGAATTNPMHRPIPERQGNLATSPRPPDTTTRNRAHTTIRKRAHAQPTCRDPGWRSR